MQCVSFGGFIRRRQRAAFARFLRHEDPRVRALAEQLQQTDARNRQLDPAMDALDPAMDALDPAMDELALFVEALLKRGQPGDVIE